MKSDTTFDVQPGANCCSNCQNRKWLTDHCEIHDKRIDSVYTTCCPSWVEDRREPADTKCGYCHPADRGTATGGSSMNLSPEEIKQWNDAVSRLTAICNKHCTDDPQCEDCPFDSMRFGEYGEGDYCGIRSGVLYTGEHKVTPSDYLRNLKEKRLRSRELLAVVKNCITCHWRNKESNFCPELGIHIMLPDTKLCDQWKPRVDLFELEQKP